MVHSFAGNVRIVRVFVVTKKRIHNTLTFACLSMRTYSQTPDYFTHLNRTHRKGRRNNADDDDYTCCVPCAFAAIRSCTYRLVYYLYIDLHLPRAKRCVGERLVIIVVIVYAGQQHINCVT